MPAKLLGEFFIRFSRRQLRLARQFWKRRRAQCSRSQGGRWSNQTLSRQTLLIRLFAANGVFGLRRPSAVHHPSRQLAARHTLPPDIFERSKNAKPAEAGFCEALGGRLFFAAPSES